MKSWSSIVSGQTSNSANNQVASQAGPSEEFPALGSQAKNERVSNPTYEKNESIEPKNDQEFKKTKQSRPRRQPRNDKPRHDTNENRDTKSAGEKTFLDRLEVEKKRYLDKYKQERDLCFKFVKGDLFSVESDFALAHCVSEDFKMSKGIATEFKKRFGKVDELLKQNVQTGGCAFIQHENRYVFYLVTKKFFHFKPYYSAVEKSLKELCKQCTKLNVTKLAMPMIGTGLDQLEWPIVSKMIDDIFSRSNIHLVIYKFDKKAIENKQHASE